MAYSVLIIDDEEELCYSLKRILERDKECKVDFATSGEEGVIKYKNGEFHIVITDLIMGKINGLETIEEIKKLNSEAIIIMITGKGSDDIAEEAIKLGAYDYFSKPFNNADFFKAIRNAKEKLELKKIKEKYDDISDKDGQFHKFSYSSEITREIVKTLKKISRFDTTILITGESGAGKGVLAESIHMSSTRKEGPFIKVNCGAIPENLIESELFGYEKGAFTGAGNGKKGKIELADGGTIFLDEIGEIDIKYQAKLLRVLEDGILEKVGSESYKKVDVRIIAATNVDLERAIEEKKFRLDLYYRLNVFKVELPSLKERKEDIINLSNFFLNEMCEKFKIEKKILSEKLKGALLAYSWPGNIRELRNTIQNLLILSGDTRILTCDNLPPPIKAVLGDNISGEEELNLKDYMKEREREYIEKMMAKYGENKTEMAKKLGISRKTLYERFAELEIKF